MISIHALREEGDHANRRTEVFVPHFYPRPPRGGRHEDRLDVTITCQFLSTPSARRATPAPQPEQPTPEISIHALREEGDICQFYPHRR